MEITLLNRSIISFSHIKIILDELSFFNKNGFTLSIYNSYLKPKILYVPLNVNNYDVGMLTITCTVPDDSTQELIKEFKTKSTNFNYYLDGLLKANKNGKGV